MIDLAFMAQWKKLVLIAISTCALLILLVVIFSRPQRVASSQAQVNPWNSLAIESTLVGVRVREVDPTHAAVVFLYDLSNQTDTDYQLASGPNLLIMSRLEPGGSLSSDRQASLTSVGFVPAKNRTRIALEIQPSIQLAGTEGCHLRARHKAARGRRSGRPGWVCIIRSGDPLPNRTCHSVTATSAELHDDGAKLRLRESLPWAADPPGASGGTNFGRGAIGL